MELFGVDGKVELEPKYDKITYLLNTGDFLVETNKKVGILSPSGETKVQIIYDSIQIMDSDAGLYVVKKDNQYGVIDINENIKIPIENNEIGMDISNFVDNDIKNKYILVDNIIPVRKDQYWALYDKNGKQLTEFKYDRFGYITSNNKNALNLLVIPNYNVIVACKDEKYTLINTSGEELFAIVADDIYMMITGGEKHYYIAANDQSMDAEEYLDKNGVTLKTQNNNNNRSQNTTSNTSNEEQNQNNRENETMEQQEQGQEEQQEEQQDYDNGEGQNQEQSQEEE